MESVLRRLAGEVTMQPHIDQDQQDRFPTDPSGLPEAGRPQLLELADGDTLDLRVAPVAKDLGDTTVRMLGYNGSIPGPTLKVKQGSEIVVNVTNEGDLETTVHWHGLRLENKYDGVPTRPRRPSLSAVASTTESSSLTPACTGTTPTSVRTTARSWVCTATLWWFPPNGTIGRRLTGTSF
jgi:FtsP/CotA-like multicopper oxidase with cupredoxin domain